IKKSLANPKVKYVRIFNMPDIKKFASREEIKTFMDGIKEIDEVLAEENEKPIRTFPSKRR
ncbi:hypothetical protein KA005_59360, partial [bacterium]|nr:hypothetical protein [bacterium]